jgi:predicted metal-dependent hydrolase
LVGDTFARLGLDGQLKCTLAYLIKAPGLLAAMSGPIARFFLPRFHPNQTDESQLLTKARAALELAST